MTQRVGAADDGVGVAVMLELIRVMSQSQTKRKNAAVFRKYINAR